MVKSIFRENTIQKKIWQKSLDEIVKESTLRWLGHVLRMDEKTLAKDNMKTIYP